MLAIRGDPCAASVEKVIYTFLSQLARDSAVACITCGSGDLLVQKFDITAFKPWKSGQAEFAPSAQLPGVGNTA